MRHIELSLAATSAVAPLTVNLLGHPMPVLASILSIVGVILASIIAPPPPLSVAKRVALVALLCLLVLGLVITEPARSPLVSVCWAVGIGYTGLPIIEEIRRRIFAQSGNLTGLPPAPDQSPNQPTEQSSPSASSHGASSQRDNNP